MHFGPLKSETCRVVNQFMNIEMFSAKLDDPVAIKKVLKEGGVDLSENKELVNYFTIDGFMNTLESKVV